MGRCSVCEWAHAQCVVRCIVRLLKGEGKLAPWMQDHNASLTQALCKYFRLMDEKPRYCVSEKPLPVTTTTDAAV